MLELEWIRYLKKFLYEKREVVASYNEDCAVIRTKGKFLLFTTDAMVEGVHFDLKFTDFYSIGYKLATSNLSDIAAMGGDPKWALLTLGTPIPPEKSWIDPFMEGLTKALKKYKAHLIGGDSVRSDKFFFNLALTGETKKPLLRKGAKVGDLIFVSRPLGGSAAFLRFIKNHSFEEIPHLIRKAYLQPEPEIKLGKVLRDIASASIDISDGLLLDLYRLCEASGVGAVITENYIPIFKKATLKEAYSGGEDYALLFTIPKKNRNKLIELCKKIRKKIFLIGEISDNKGKICIMKKRGRWRRKLPLLAMIILLLKLNLNCFSFTFRLLR